MKVAIATSEAAGISHHFDRSANWLIFDVSDGDITEDESRPNTCTHQDVPDSGGSQEQQEIHNRTGIPEVLRGCSAVISGGMGWRAAEELGRNGITPFVVDPRHTPEEAIQLYVDGELAAVGQGFRRGGYAR